MFFRFLSLIFILCTISNVNAAQYDSFKKKLSRSINTELNTYGIPGAAYVVVKGDKVIAIESFGYTDKTNKQKINANTVFRLASVSKPFAATIATMLSQEKKLNLSDPITKFLPNFALASKGAAEKIQLTHLLSH